MKKYLFVITTMLLLAGCASETSEEKPHLSTKTEPVENVDKELVNGKSASPTTFKTGDLIIDKVESLEREYYYNSYYFGGFVNNDTFIINVNADESTKQSVGYAFYYPTKEGLVITLPISNITLKVVSINIEENTIEFEQL